MTAEFAVTDTVVEAGRCRWRILDANSDHSEPPLVLLHGGGLDSAELSYGAALPVLARNRRVITPDLPGYGRSDGGEAPYTIEWYVETLHALLEVLELDPIDLGGLSLGGGISIAYALAHPARVRRLVLLAPYGLTTRVPARRTALFLQRHQRLNEWLGRQTVRSRSVTRLTLRSLIHRKDKRTAEILNAVMAAAREPGSTEAWSAFQRSEIGRSGLRTCFTGRLADLQTPTLILCGRNDRLVRTENCKAAAAELSHGKAVVLDDCAHWIARDQPDRACALIDEFLATAR